MIGNREIWDKGIGMGATQAVFGGQSSSPNYDPLMSDPNAKPPEPTVETAAQEPLPANQAQGGNTPAAPSGPKKGPYDKQLKNAQLKMQQLQQQLMYAVNENEKANIRYRMNQQLREIQKWETSNAQWA